MPTHSVSFYSDSHIARITLNRPETGNAITAIMSAELADICSAINADNDIYVVVLTGSGNSFCTGSDGIITGPANAIAGIERPVIAVVNGPALAEGLELALAADIRICSESASFGLPQVGRGILPSNGGTQRLPRIVGRGKALELLLTTETISAAEALEIGLVSSVYTEQELETEAKKLADNVAAKGPLALRYLKEAVIKGMDMTLEQGLRLEADLYFLLHTTADRTEGITSFREKRNPEYKGN